MAAVGGHNDMLQVLAHRHHRSMTTNTAARTKRHRNTSNNKDGSRQRNVNPRLQNRDSALRGNIQPTPSPRFADPSLAMEEAQTSPSGLPVSSAAEADTLPIGNTVAPRAAIVGDPGALPGVNQPDPGTFSKPMPGVNQPDPGRMDAPLPGKNQPPPLMGDAAAPPPPQGMPGMNPPGPGVMNPPMPGTNQPPPLIGDAAAPPPPKGMPGMNPPGPGAMNPPGPGVMNPPMPGKDQPQPLQDMPASILCTSITTYTTQTQARTDPTLTISKSGMNTGFSWPTPSTTGVPSVGSSVPGLAPLPSFSTFILFSRSEDIREQVTTSTNSANTPLAVTASSALTAISVPALLPTSSSIASSATGGPSRGLTPLSRSLFVLFGVLGAITMLIALAIFYVARRNKKRQELAERYIEETASFEDTKAALGYGNTTRISADTPDNNMPTVLTDSERNIVRRAATQDGQPEIHITAPGARLHDAINNFIAKSRRLTYKISP